MTATLKLYMDEHVPRAVSAALRRRGIDVLTVVEAGMIAATDEDHLKLARSQRRVLFTQDADFLRFHNKDKSHAGNVYAPQRTPVGAIVNGLLLICQVLDADDMWNQVEFI